jgi:hypothetical protein
MTLEELLRRFNLPSPIESLRRTGQDVANVAEGTFNAVTRGVPQQATGFVDLAALPFTMSGLLDEKDVVGGTKYLTERGLLPPETENIGGQSAEMALSMASPAGMVKGGLLGLGALGATATKGLSKASKVAKTETELAFEVAQKNASLPIEQGGLGLPKDNTPMDRAKAMGFDIEAYHGTINPDIMAFDPMMGKGAREGTGSWFSENPELASTYAGNMGGTVMPVLIKDRKFAVVDAEGKNWARLTPDTTIYHSNRTDTPASDLIENLFHDYTNTNDIARFAKQQGDKGVRFFNIKDQGARMRGVGDVPETADNLTVFDPAMIRSRFAAFDPAKRNSANILAGTALGGVGLSSLLSSGDGDKQLSDEDLKYLMQMGLI